MKLAHDRTSSSQFLLLTCSFVEVVQKELLTNGDDVHDDSSLKLSVLLVRLNRNKKRRQ